ncbi:hypothetical protein BGZ83_012053 [Gryganskiella cystojenkinii]|nr:hypothetical protein BGZ83_012053 [Gryganskiella cystojenkinii]
MHRPALLLTLAAVALGASARFDAAASAAAQDNTVQNYLNPATLATRDLNVLGNINKNDEDQTRAAIDVHLRRRRRDNIIDTKVINVDIGRRHDKIIDNKVINVDLDRRGEDNIINVNVVDPKVLEEEKSRAIIDVHLRRRGLAVDADAALSHRHRRDTLEVSNAKILKQDEIPAEVKVLTRDFHDLSVNTGLLNREKDTLVDVNSNTEKRNIVNADVLKTDDNVVQVKVLDTRHVTADADLLNTDKDTPVDAQAHAGDYNINADVLKSGENPVRVNVIDTRDLNIDLLHTSSPADVMDDNLRRRAVTLDLGFSQGQHRPLTVHLCSTGRDPNADILKENEAPANVDIDPQDPNVDSDLWNPNVDTRNPDVNADVLEKDETPVEVKVDRRDLEINADILKKDATAPMDDVKLNRRLLDLSVDEATQYRDPIDVDLFTRDLDVGVLQGEGLHRPTIVTLNKKHDGDDSAGYLLRDPERIDGVAALVRVDKKKRTLQANVDGTKYDENAESIYVPQVKAVVGNQMLSPRRHHSEDDDDEENDDDKGENLSESSSETNEKTKKSSGNEQSPSSETKRNSASSYKARALAGLSLVAGSFFFFLA